MSDAPSTAAAETDAAATTAPKKSKKSLLIIIIILLVVGGGGGGGFFYLRAKAAASTTDEAKDKKSKKSKSEESEEEGSEEEEKEKSEKESDESESENSKTKTKKTSASKAVELSLPEDDEVKHVIELQPFVINLADADQARYLRLTVSLGIGENEGHSEEKADPIFMTRVRNAMLAVLTTKTSEDVLTNEGKIKLRKELLKAAKKSSEAPEVLAIYITDFIVQL